MPRPPEEQNDYEVGYKKPPKTGQFKPGQSGNPRGRRRVAKKPSQILDDALRSRISVIENGKKVTKTKTELLFNQIVNNAIKGDKYAIKQVTDHIKSKPEVSEEDEKQRIELAHMMIELLNFHSSMGRLQYEIRTEFPDSPEAQEIYRRIEINRTTKRKNILNAS